MLDIDLLTTYVICGAASCAGAVLTAMARTGDAALSRAIRISGAGFAVLGLSLLQLVLGVDDAMAPTMLLALAGTTLGLGMVGCGLAMLAGQPAGGALVMVLALAALLWQLVAVQRSGPMALGVAYSAGLALMCACTLWAMRGFLLRPRSAAEHLLAWSMVAFVLSYALRAALAAVHDGPPTLAHAYGPPWVLRLLGILYGVMPVVMATLLLSVVNARLAAQLAAHAMTDELTGALNRRALGDQAPALARAVHDTGRTLAVMLLDIDHFKSINDTHGHPAGDAVLRQLVPALRAPLRQDALVMRYGGEEFALLVPVEHADAARTVAERVRAAVAATVFRTDGRSIGVTASIGLTLAQPGEGIEQALQRADAALYRAKQGGRNRVETNGMAPGA